MSQRKPEAHDEAHGINWDSYWKIKLIGCLITEKLAFCFREAGSRKKGVGLKENTLISVIIIETLKQISFLVAKS